MTGLVSIGLGSTTPIFVCRREMVGVLMLEGSPKAHRYSISVFSLGLTKVGHPTRHCYQTVLVGPDDHPLVSFR